MEYAVAAQKAWVINDNRILMIRYSRVDNHPGFDGTWGLPGGKVDLDESLDDSLRREVKEETGVTIRPGLPVGIVEFHTPHPEQKHVMVVIRLAKLSGSTKLNNGTRDRRSTVNPAWIPHRRVASLPLAHDERAEILRLLAAV